MIDGGNGIPTNIQSKIFDHFYEIQGQKSYGQFKYGSGIGLAIVKKLVELKANHHFVQVMDEYL